MRPMLLAVAFTFGFAGASLAQSEELDCTDPQTQAEMNMCAWADYEAADNELNAVWKDAKAMAKQVDEEQYEDRLKGAEKALLEAQRGWIVYRDGHCELAGFEARGGTMEPMVKSYCLETLTRARTKELREFADGFGN